MFQKRTSRLNVLKCNVCFTRGKFWCVCIETNLIQRVERLALYIHIPNDKRPNTSITATYDIPSRVRRRILTRAEFFIRKRQFEHPQRSRSDLSSERSKTDPLLKSDLGPHRIHCGCICVPRELRSSFDTDRIRCSCISVSLAAGSAILLAYALPALRARVGGAGYRISGNGLNKMVRIKWFEWLERLVDLPDL